LPFRLSCRSGPLAGRSGPCPAGSARCGSKRASGPEYNERMSVLAIDIGNSSIRMGLPGAAFRAEAFPRAGREAQEWANLIRKFLGATVPAGAAVSSVVPELTGIFLQGVERVLGVRPLLVSYRDAGALLAFDLKEPEAMGMDRAAAAVAAAALLGPPVAVVDVGTATTVNFVTPARGGSSLGVYRGGAILPGVDLMARSLAEGTAQLPRVRPGRAGAAVGRDTKENILSGIIYGTAGAVEKVIEVAERETGEAYTVVVTGGAAGLVAPLLRRVDALEPWLTLKGLGLIYEKVQTCMS
jgi:type III pantothenate kinase